MKKTYSLLFLAFSAFVFSQKKWSLQECVDYAAKNNLQVIGNQFGNEIQAKNLEIAKKDHLPTVSGSMGNNANFGQGRDVFGNVRRNDNFSNNASVGANMLLYNNGRIKKSVEKSQLELEASFLDTQETKNNISLQIAQQYLQVLLNKEVKNITTESLQNAEKLLKRAKITTEVGTTPKTIEAEAQANFYRAKQRQKSAEIDINRSLFALAMLLQLKDYQDFDVQEIPLPENLEEPINNTNQILETAFINQPQVKAAETRLLASQKQTEIMRTNFYPTVSANAGIGTSFFDPLAYQNNGFFQQYKDNFGQQLGVNINVPIFNKGITKIQVEQAKISENIAKNTIELRKQDVLQNVQKAEFDANANFQNYLAAVEAEKSAKLALNFAEKSYEAGKSTIYDLNNSRNNWVNAQSTVSQAKYNYLFSLKLLNFYAGIPLSL